MAITASWLGKHKITIDKTKVTSGTHTDFPVLFKDGNFLNSAFNDTLPLSPITNSWAIDDANIKGYWKVDTGALTTDSSGNSHTLTNNNTVAEATGLFNVCADFGSANTNKYLNIADNLDITGGAISMSIWVKLNAEIASGEWCFIMQGSETNFVRNMIEYEYNSGTRRLRFRRTRSNVADDDALYTITLGTSSWYLLTYTYDATTVRGYVNGVLVTSVASSGNGTATGIDQVSIGARNPAGTPDEYASFLQDDTAIWNRKLTSQEVWSIYNNYAPDLRFTSDFSGLNELPFEIVRWDNASTAEVWVKIPSLYSSIDTDVYVWYKNTSAKSYKPSASLGSQNVWPSGYKGVWHLQNGAFIDSTSNEHYLTNSGSVDATGKIGQGRDLESGSTQYLTIADSIASALEITGSQTYSIWYKPESSAAEQYIFGKVNSANSTFRVLFITASATPRILISGLSDGDISSSQTVSNGSWSRLAARYVSGSTLAVFHNKNKDSQSDSGTASSLSTTDFSLGRGGEYNGSYTDGVIDEARVYSGALSDGWLDTEYDNQNSPSTFAIASSLGNENIVIPQSSVSIGRSYKIVGY